MTTLSKEEMIKYLESNFAYWEDVENHFFVELYDEFSNENLWYGWELTWLSLGGEAFLIKEDEIITNHDFKELRYAS